MTLHNVKDTTPNPHLVEGIELLLEEAKSGELRSLFFVKGWNDDASNHGWNLDYRSDRRRMLAEMVMAQHDFIINLELRERSSVLARALED